MPVTFGFFICVIDVMRYHQAMNYTLRRQIGHTEKSETKKCFLTNKSYLENKKFLTTTEVVSWEETARNE